MFTVSREKKNDRMINWREHHTFFVFKIAYEQYTDIDTLIINYKIVLEKILE